MFDPVAVTLVVGVALAIVALFALGAYLNHRINAHARKRAAAILAPAPIPRTCANCKHFDLEEGQASMGKFPIFLQAAAHIPPSEMGRSVVEEVTRDCRACEGTGKEPTPAAAEHRGPPPLQDCARCGGTGKQTDELFSKPSASAKSKWQDFGACMRDQVVVDGADTVELRLARLNASYHRHIAIDCFELSE